MSESPPQASSETGTERTEEKGTTLDVSNDPPEPSAATGDAGAAAGPTSSVPQGAAGVAADPEPDTEDPTTKGPPLTIDNPDPEDEPPTDDA